MATMSLALSHAYRSQITAPNGRVAVEPVLKRIRVRFAGEVIADSTNALLLLERDRLPVYYLPLADIRTEFLEAVDTISFCPWKGTARYWDIVVGDRRSANAVWNYPEAHEDALDLRQYVAFYWNRVDDWYEEDERVSVHPRDPYVRVDVLRSSRHVTASIGDTALAESRDTRILFETGQPPRFFFPRIGVTIAELNGSDTVSASPYLGTARHLAYQTGDGALQDVAWFYVEPTPEAAALAELVTFDPDRVTIRDEHED
jgi:uncharacterized protein (DUF427 family)